MQEPDWGSKTRKAEKMRPIGHLSLAAYKDDDQILDVIDLARRTNTQATQIARWLLALGLEVATDRGLLPEEEE